MDISSLVCSANASIIKVKPRKKGASDYFPDDAVGEIAAANLDVPIWMLHYGSALVRILRPLVTNCPARSVVVPS